MLMVRYISATRVNTLVFLKVEDAISLPCSASSATVIVEACEERHRILFDRHKLLARCLFEPHIIRRPAALERGLVGWQVFERGFDDFDHDDRRLGVRPASRT